jgi:phenylacetate-CoA ligase
MAHPLEHFYPYLPVWAQNLGISLYGLAYKRERLGGQFEHCVRAFRAREQWTAERLSDYTDRELRRVLLRCFDSVPYYAAAWKAHGVTRSRLERVTAAELPSLPVLPKRDLRQDPDAFVAATTPRRALLRYYSSGTTGTPITAICTAADHQRFIAAREARSFQWAGVSVRWPRAMIGGRMIVPAADAKPPYYRYNFAERQVYLTAYHLGPATVRNYVEGLNRYRPRVFTGYAYSHYLLSRLMLEQGLTLDYTPLAAILGSEKTTPEMRDVISRALKLRVYEEYGAVEQCALATECHRGSLHVNTDFGIVEIVDDDGLPVRPGVEGRLLCTSLVNDTQPLIRYDIGDVGSWSTAQCACGRPLPVLASLVGRQEDAVIAPDGREMVRFHGIFVGMPHLLEAQVVQEEVALIRVRVAGTPEFGADDEELIRRRIAHERLGDVRVVIERVPAIERTARGKFRAVISNIPPEQRRALRRAAGARAVSQ